MSTAAATMTAVLISVFKSRFPPLSHIHPILLDQLMYSPPIGNDEKKVLSEEEEVSVSPKARKKTHSISHKLLVLLLFFLLTCIDI